MLTCTHIHYHKQKQVIRAGINTTQDAFAEIRSVTTLFIKLDVGKAAPTADTSNSSNSAHNPQVSGITFYV
jgi:hypothetical protein